MLTIVLPTIMKYCRACLKFDIKMIDLNDDLNEMFWFLLNIEVTQTPATSLCYLCHSVVRQLYKFRQKCHVSDKALSNIIDGGNKISKSSLREFAGEERLSSTAVKQTCLCDCCTRETHTEHFSSDDELPLADVKTEINHEDKQAKVCKKRTRRPLFNAESAREVYLSVEQQIEELKSRENSDNYISSVYRCTHCYRGFITNRSYTTHMRKHDPFMGDHVCGICMLRYATPRLLRAHTLHAHSRRYICNICRTVMHTPNQAREHDRWHQGHLYKCELCGATFRKPTSQLTHMRKNHPMRVCCPECGDTFISRQGLMMHRAKSHQNSANDVSKADSSLYCEECKVQFSTEQAYKRHFVTSAVHSKEFGTGCRVCGARFESRQELSAHTKLHASQEKYNQSNKLFKCDHCARVYGSRASCRSHMRRVHQGVRYTKSIVCEVCAKCCNSMAALKAHQRVHTGDRPYQCGHCDKRFADTTRLRVHTRTHTDERPYVCSACGRTFRQKPALNRHMRVHTGVKPYRCQHCNKCFTQSNSLKVHIKGVHYKIYNKLLNNTADNTSFV